MRNQIADCRGMSASQIAERLGDLEQDEVARELVSMIGERTDVDRFSLPYSVGVTMYGDADVSELRLRYEKGGCVVEPGEATGADLDTRWEHWEDAVRLLNGDLPSLSLLYARRITIGDEPTTSNEPLWFRAVDFAPETEILARGRVLTRLMDAHDEGEKELRSYTERTGLGAIGEARSIVVAWSLLESGCGEDIKGTHWKIAHGDAPAVATVVISDRSVTPATASLPDKGGITLRYATAEAMVAEATGERTFQELLVNGQVRVEGNDDDRARFAKSLMSFARLHGI